MSGGVNLRGNEIRTICLGSLWGGWRGGRRRAWGENRGRQPCHTPKGTFIGEERPVGPFLPAVRLDFAYAPANLSSTHRTSKLFISYPAFFFFEKVDLFDNCRNYLILPSATNPPHPFFPFSIPPFSLSPIIRPKKKEGKAIILRTHSILLLCSVPLFFNPRSGTVLGKKKNPQVLLSFLRDQGSRGKRGVERKKKTPSCDVSAPFSLPLFPFSFL